MESQTKISIIVLLMLISGVIFFTYFTVTSDEFKNYQKADITSYDNKIKIVEGQIRGDINTNMTTTEIFDIIDFDCKLYFPAMVGKYGNQDYTQCKVDMKPKFINITH